MRVVVRQRPRRPARGAIFSQVKRQTCGRSARAEGLFELRTSSCGRRSCSGSSARSGSSRCCGSRAVRPRERTLDISRAAVHVDRRNAFASAMPAKRSAARAARRTPSCSSAATVRRILRLQVLSTSTRPQRGRDRGPSRTNAPASRRCCAPSVVSAKPATAPSSSTVATSPIVAERDRRPRHHLHARWSRRVPRPQRRDNLLLANWF